MLSWRKLLARFCWWLTRSLSSTSDANAYAPWCFLLPGARHPLQPFPFGVCCSKARDLVLVAARISPCFGSQLRAGDSEEKLRGHSLIFPPRCPLLALVHPALCVPGHGSTSLPAAAALPLRGFRCAWGLSPQRRPPHAQHHHAGHGGIIDIMVHDLCLLEPFIMTRSWHGRQGLRALVRSVQRACGHGDCPHESSRLSRATLTLLQDACLAEDCTTKTRCSQRWTTQEHYRMSVRSFLLLGFWLTLWSRAGPG